MRSKTPDPFELPSSLDEAFKAWTKIQKLGFDPIEVSPPKLVGTFSFSNQWKEQAGGNRAGYTWSGGADCSATASGKFKVSTALMGIPPFIAQAGLYIGVEGKFGIAGNVSYDQLNPASYSVTGGASGNAKIKMGGEANVVAGLLSVDVNGNTGITASGNFIGEKEPPKIYCEFKLELDAIVVEYQVSSVWGLYSSTDSWQVTDSMTLYQKKEEIVPAMFKYISPAQ